MGWLIALAVIAALAVLPLGVSAKYDAQGPYVAIIAGPARITVIPWKKKPKEEKPKKEKKKAAPKEKKATQPETKQESGGKLTDFLPLVRVALDFLGGFGRKLRVDRLEMKLIMAASDPCDLAVNYGRAWAAVGNLMPRLEELFVIRKKDVNVECDFTADVTTVTARLDITITLGRITVLTVRYGIRTVREFLKIMKTRKGGAEK